MVFGPADKVGVEDKCSNGVVDTFVHGVADHFMLYQIQYKLDRVGLGHHGQFLADKAPSGLLPLPLSILQKTGKV